MTDGKIEVSTINLNNPCPPSKKISLIELLGKVFWFPLTLIRTGFRVLLTPKLVKYFLILLILGVAIFPISLKFAASFELKSLLHLSLDNWRDLIPLENRIKSLIPNYSFIRGPGAWLWNGGKSAYFFFLRAVEWMLDLFSRLLFILAATVMTLACLIITWEVFFLDLFLTALMDENPVFRNATLPGVGLGGMVHAIFRSLYHVVLFVIIDVFLWLVSLIFPPLLVIGFIFSSWRMGREFLLLPLEIKGLPFPDRMAIIRNHPEQAFCHGFCLKILFYLPFGFLFLPAVYAVTVQDLGAWDDVRKFMTDAKNPEPA